VTEQLKLWLYQFQAVRQLQQQGAAARIQYDLWFYHFMHEGVHAW
jgi:hypothetical protein